MSLPQAIAAAAARLVVEDGLDYGAAKRKAARELQRHGGGSVRAGAMPSDEEVEDQVREHIAIFHADEQGAELLALRELALRWMRRLAEFRPHLAGAVWRGTATRRSTVLLDLYCDDPKSAEIALLNAGVRFDTGALERRGGGEPLNVLLLQDRCPALGQPVPLQLVLRDLDDLRGALRPDARGQSWRGDLAALERRLAEDDTA